MIIESVMLFGQGGPPHGGRGVVIILNYVTVEMLKEHINWGWQS